MVFGARGFTGRLMARNWSKLWIVGGRNVRFIRAASTVRFLAPMQTGGL